MNERISVASPGSARRISMLPLGPLTPTSLAAFTIAAVRLLRNPGVELMLARSSLGVGERSGSMKGLLVGAFALVLAAASPAFAQHRPHAAPSGSHPTSHVRSHPIAHAARPQSAHHAVRTSSHRTVHHAATHATRHAAHHAARHTVRHAAHHAVHPAARQEVRHAVAAAAKGPFARVQKTVYAKRRFHAGVYRSPPGWVRS